MSGDHSLVLARQSIATHSKSFALASRVLPGQVRDRAVVLYAWCRRADDAIDLAPAGHRAASLERLRTELADVYGGRPLADPTLAGFAQVVHDSRIPSDYAAELLAGMEMDVSGHRYAHHDEVLRYCFRVAGTVGLMMTHVMGVSDEAALRNASHLGIAMQLTNICRDVREDWQLGRLYLPEELLAEHGVAGLAGELGGRFPEAARAPVARATRALLAEAQRYYASGDGGLRALSWRCALAVRTARLVYSRIGERVAAHGCDPLAPRAVVPTWRKLALVGRAAVAAAAEAPARTWRQLAAGAPAIVPDRLVRFHDVLPI